MKVYSCEGVVINKNEYGEGSLHLTVFTDCFGKINLFIKGVRKSKNREQTAVDVLTLSKFVLIKRNEGYSVSSFETLNHYTELKKDINSIYLSLYIFSLLNNCLAEKEKREEIYQLTKKTINFLNTENDENRKKLCLIYFLHKWIENEGLLSNDLKDWEQFQKKLKNSILEGFLKKQYKKVINEKYDKSFLIGTLFLYEKYINFHSETKLNLKKYLLE
ncbi:MAG: DNA repair protein RecO [Fusobacteriaceae bacterium]